ncbi:clostripain-related cysteine peptidase [Sphingobacterium corticibacter]|uniref:Clostripain n=1 Tax=Sphingobacterium corticibacter TaxID=2171749 RepID=A0A2T8HEY0_9SPHI|nr:clostripain-related cysteine peptidase [Sphingobacterium corticibacter]PVH23963.1 clostripain [Sphingobacterium corticibacter]
MMLRHRYILLVLSTLFACQKATDEVLPATRTVMVYMAANNSLAADAYNNLNQMEAGFTGIDGEMIVYARIFGQQPKIYQIVHDTSTEIRSRVLKTYADHDSSDPDIMRMVFTDMQSLAPAHSYGAILWSHATNWAPAELPRKATIVTRSFGDDNFRSMDVQALKKALPINLDFLIFDACSMASVEVLYELRHIAPYILASPTEVLSVGMPYHEINQMLYYPDVKFGLQEIARSYIDYYNQKSGLEQSATFSLIDTKALSVLAEVTKEILLTHPNLRFSRSGVQRLDLDRSSPVMAFDFLDMFQQQQGQAFDLSKLESAINRAVLYKAHTQNFLGQPIRAFSGLSTYIPVTEEAQLFPFYSSLEWVSAAGYEQLLK